MRNALKVFHLLGFPEDPKNHTPSFLIQEQQIDGGLS
jgi:hypothetical protein